MSETVPMGHPTGKLECKSVGVVVLNKDGEILLLDRRKGVLGWACPAGHLDPGEDHLAALKRELFEETGVKVNDSAKMLLHADVQNACKRGFEAHEWWIYALEAETDHIELKEPDKHKGIGWFKPAEVEALELEPVWRTILENVLTRKGQIISRHEC